MYFHYISCTDKWKMVTSSECFSREHRKSIKKWTVEGEHFWLELSAVKFLQYLYFFNVLSSYCLWSTHVHNNIHITSHKNKINSLTHPHKHTHTHAHMHTHTHTSTHTRTHTHAHKHTSTHTHTHAHMHTHTRTQKSRAHSLNLWPFLKSHQFIWTNKRGCQA